MSSSKKKAPKKAPAKKRAAAKKTTSKKATKKTGQKAKKRSGKVLAVATGEQCFWVNGGPILKDIEELKHALTEMPKEVFAYHTSGGQNDFAEWVEHVLGDETLAKSLRRAKTIASSTSAIDKRLKDYQRS